MALPPAARASAEYHPTRSSKRGNGTDNDRGRGTQYTDGDYLRIPIRFDLTHTMIARHSFFVPKTTTKHERRGVFAMEQMAESR